MFIKSIFCTTKKHSYHWHNGIVLFRVIKGVIKVRVRAEDSYLKKDDIIIFNVGEIHQIESITEDNIVSLTYIDALYCKKVVDNFDQIVFYCNSSKNGELHECKYNKLREYIDKLIINQNTDNNAYELLSYLTENFDYITCGIELKKFSKKICQRNTQLYKSVMLSDGEYKEYSLKEVASYIGVNYSYLRQDIVERYGHGYKWLKHIIMVENATKMILSTNIGITYIGEYCGFSDPKYMIKYFKKFFNCTPSEFRKLYKDNYIGECSIENLPVDRVNIFKIGEC
jgi:AraC-like DNA-binding protein